jgi:hypothetical protein
MAATAGEVTWSQAGPWLAIGTLFSLMALIIRAVPSWLPTLRALFDPELLRLPTPKAASLIFGHAMELKDNDFHKVRPRAVTPKSQCL